MEALIEAETAYDDEVIGDSPIPRTFEDAADRFPERPAQMYKGGVYDRSLVGSVIEAAPPDEFRTLAYRDMQDIVRNLAAGFRSLGIESDDRVAMYAHTRMEWAQADYALLAAGAVVTTVYPNSTDDRLRYLLDHPSAKAVVVENADLLEQVIEVEDDLASLEVIVSIDSIDGHPAAQREDVHTLAEVHELGTAEFDPAAYERWIDDRALADLASIIYTSGTTGRPKGVKLTHRNFRANINQIRRRFGPRADRPASVPSITEETRVVSYLPLAHVFERLAGHFLMFASGSCVAYAESPETLQEDFASVEPTTATSVPRVYERMYKAIREQAQSSSIKARIFGWATDVGERYHKADQPGLGLRLKRSIADRLVFSTVRDALGGQIDFMISGGGSLSPDLCALYHGMGLPILEGYGLTETAPVISVNPPEQPEIGTIGPPLTDVEITLDTDAQAPGDADTIGELLVKGPNVTDGYLKNPGANERAFTDDGWFRTGDLVEQRDDGYLVFKERLKEVIVLSTGKNVAPGPMEDAFAPSKLVEQAMVIGDDQPYIAALIVPSFEGIRRWAEDQDFSLPDDPETICEDPRVIGAIGDEIDELNERFESHERIREFRLIPEEFTEDNDLLTPTMKKKRRNILDRYEDQVEKLFEAADL